jgi:hypothetical protein
MGLKEPWTLRLLPRNSIDVRGAMMGLKEGVSLRLLPSSCIVVRVARIAMMELKVARPQSPPPRYVRVRHSAWFNMAVLAN